MGRSLQLLSAASLIMLAACGGGGSSTPTPAPTTTYAPTSASVNPGTQTTLTLNGSIGTASLVLWTSPSWPSNVTANATFVTTGAPTAQSAVRKAQAANSVSTWQITFSGATGTGSLTTAPIVFLSTGSQNQASFVIELFDATSGGTPLLFFFNQATNEQYVAAGATFEVNLADTFYLEVVQSSAHGQTTFTYTGASQSFVVPTGVTSLLITAAGAENGGLTTATIPVTAGATLDVEVGGADTNGSGGYNGGGAGGTSFGTTGPGGGGASDVRVGGTALSNRVVVAGAGGGGVCETLPGGCGGAGGGLTGGAGGGGAGGATQTAGGVGGGPCGPDAAGGTSGISGVGGSGGGSSIGANLNGGGGGGGWYGGGGGGGWGLPVNSGPCTTEPPFGGGGGSSYAEPSATNVTMTQGGQSGNGYVTIVW